MRSQSIRYRCFNSFLYENNRLDTDAISAISEADRYNSNMVGNPEKHVFAWHFLFLRPRYDAQIAEKKNLV